jgi:hypothetical protein
MVMKRTELAIGRYYPTTRPVPTQHLSGSIRPGLSKEQFRVRFGKKRSEPDSERILALEDLGWVCIDRLFFPGKVGRDFQ